jgi:hypothetical protein
MISQEPGQVDVLLAGIGMRLVYKTYGYEAFINVFMSTVRWNLAVSSDTDQSVRMLLASQGGGRECDLSRFVEQAVCTYIVERAVDHAKAANAHVSEADLAAIVDEAVQWAREH